MTTPSARLRVAVAYARSATPAAASGDRQLQDAAAYAYAHGYDLTGSFQDRGASGLQLPRTGLSELMTFAQEHEARTCLVTDLTRLARSALTHYTILDRFHAHGITQVVFVHTGHRVATNPRESPRTTLLNGNLSTIAEFNSTHGSRPAVTGTRTVTR